MKRLIIVTCIMLICSVVLAQSEQQEFISDDETLRFMYPADWDASENSDGTITLQLPDTVITLSLSDSLSDDDSNNPAQVAAGIARLNNYLPVDFNLFDSATGTVARYDYNVDDVSGTLLVFSIDAADSPSALVFDSRPDNGILDSDTRQDIEILVTTLELTTASSDSNTADILATATPSPDENNIDDENSETNDDVSDDTEPVSADGLVAFSSEDETLSLRHPPDWFMGQEDDSAVFGFLADPAMSLTIYPPESLIAQRYRMRADSAEQFLEGYGNFNATLSAIETLDIGDYSAAKRNISADTEGLYIALQLPDGAFIIAEGFMFGGDFSDDAEDAMLEILETVAYSGDIVAENPDDADTASLPVLRDYRTRDLVPVLNQLRLAGVIPFGGSPAFGEDFAFFQGTGTTFFQFSTRETAQNLVMAGEITYIPGSDNQIDEECALAARLFPGEVNIDAYTSFGVTSENMAFFRERALDESIDLLEEQFRLDATVNTPIHFLLVLFDERLIVFIEGEPVFTSNDLEVRQGLYAIYLRSNSTNTRCETRIVRVYELPQSFVPGLCEVRVDGLVNRRAGAGTEFGSVGQLEAGESARLVGQTTGSDGFLWWQLEDQSWVRDDVVFAEGDCRSLFE